MHVDIRYGEQTVVKNDFDDGWGDEESSDFSGLQPGEHFVIKIQVTADSYAVHVNGVNVGEFKQRGPLNDVTHLLVFHDVTVNNVSLDEQKLVQVN